MFETSIHIMIGYVVRKYDNGDDIKMKINKLTMPVLEKPKDLDSMANGKYKEIYR